ncbi:fungal cellulose binding domain-containing protein [Clohesyomyces aquaticus]|uniref:Feruloyl esterase C n=1 Tax=Clohesyomyces aquaticus TaxID=1231657 RepID=A0A1Y1Y7H8_9PLEO|nr:fungal cellulose binding domain-containing protein [Clohesyomyces aquaticus]
MIVPNYIITSALLALGSFFDGAQAASAGCGKAPTLKAGTNTITVDGKAREYIITPPDNYDNTKPYRLILGLHWLGGKFTDVTSGSMIKPYYGLPPLANGTAIFVAPNGLNNGWQNTGNADVTFIAALIKSIEAEYCVNENLRFSTGFSYGGAMSYALACSMPKDFRAVAVQSGNPQISGCVGGKDPVAYYHQHGVSDQVLPIAGARQMVAQFAKNNGCTSQTPPEPAKGSHTHIRTKFAGCATDKPVWFTAFDGDHTPIPADAATTSKETSWTGASVWEFFSQFS